MKKKGFCFGRVLFCFGVFLEDNCWSCRRNSYRLPFDFEVPTVNGTDPIPIGVSRAPFFGRQWQSHLLYGRLLLGRRYRHCRERFQGGGACAKRGESLQNPAMSHHFLKGEKAVQVLCKDLLSLPSFRQIELVAGRTGLNRPVRWPYVTVTYSIDKWVQGGELMFVSGIGYGQDESVLMGLLQESIEKRLAGVVILVGQEYIREIPPQLIKLADQADFPLFQMPYSIPLVLPTEEISNLIVKNQMEDRFLSELMVSLFTGDCGDEDAVAAKAAFYKFDLSGSHQVAVIVPELAQDRRKVDGIDFLLELQRTVDNVLKLHGCRMPTMLDCGSITCLFLWRSAPAGQQLEQILLQVREALLRKDGIEHVWIATGRRYERLCEIAQSKDEAEKALRVLKERGKDDVIGDFDKLGIFKVLFGIRNLTEIHRFCGEILGRLEAADAQGGTNYLQTLEIYLEENCNAVHAARRLFLHRNSLNYRIRKIEAILGCDLSSNKERLKLRDAFLLRSFLRIAE